MPLDPHPSPAGHLRGRAIEDRLLRHLVAMRGRRVVEDFRQPDALAFDADRAYLIERKAQDRFVPPPFYGHGLPVTQADRYARIHEVAGLRTLFLVFDEVGVCMQWLDALELGRVHQTAGTIKTPRRIYDLAGFVRPAGEREAA